MLRTRWRMLFGVLIGALIILMPACANSDDEDAVMLDVDTLQAESDAGTFEAEAVPNAFVGEVTEDLFIGVTVYDDGQYADENIVGVYLCDDGTDTNASLSGELGSDGVADLAAELDDGSEVQVTLAVEDDVVTGEVIASDEDAQSFTATPASGDAGLYVAEETFDEEEHRATWIVLEDGRQRGITCPPFPLIVCLPTGPGPSQF